METTTNHIYEQLPFQNKKTLQVKWEREATTTTAPPSDYSYTQTQFQVHVPEQRLGKKPGTIHKMTVPFWTCIIFCHFRILEDVESTPCTCTYTCTLKYCLEETPHVDNFLAKNYGTICVHEVFSTVKVYSRVNKFSIAMHQVGRK